MTHRGLILNRDAAALAYETGDSPAGRMAAVLALAQAGLVRCESCPDGMQVHLTEAGRARALHRQPVLPAGGAAPPAAAFGWAPPSVRSGPPPARPWTSPSVTEQPPARLGDAPAPGAADPATMAELGRLIGTDQVERLRGRLIEMLTTSFGDDADAATLARQAHILISAAGSLGFDHLAARCRALEGAIRSHRDYRTELMQARRAAKEIADRHAADPSRAPV